MTCRVISKVSANRGPLYRCRKHLRSRFPNQYRNAAHAVPGISASQIGRFPIFIIAAMQCLMFCIHQGSIAARCGEAGAIYMTKRFLKGLTKAPEPQGSRITMEQVVQKVCANCIHFEQGTIKWHGVCRNPSVRFNGMLVTVVHTCFGWHAKPKQVCATCKHEIGGMCSNFASYWRSYKVDVNTHTCTQYEPGK